jgi:hypothetical protein
VEESALLMKKRKSLLAILFAVLIFQGCVISTSSISMKTDNGFYLTVKDSAGNEIKTSASINDPEYIPELTEMYCRLVEALERIIKEQRK